MAIWRVHPSSSGYFSQQQHQQCVIAYLVPGSRCQAWFCSGHAMMKTTRMNHFAVAAWRTLYLFLIMWYNNVIDIISYLLKFKILDDDDLETGLDDGNVRRTWRPPMWWFTPTFTGFKRSTSQTPRSNQLKRSNHLDFLPLRFLRRFRRYPRYPTPLTLRSWH